MAGRTAERLKRPGAAFRGLHVLVDDDPRWERDPVEQARTACAGGAAVVQLRVKHASDQQTLTWGRAIRSLTRKRDARFVMNDRFDLALACEADAVHLGQTDLPPRALPPAARKVLAVGRSTHDLDQARAAAVKLKEMEGLEETNIRLGELLKGRGFRDEIYLWATQKYGIGCVDVIRKNPFRLLIDGAPGAGFLRCDRLWLELVERRD